MVISTRRIVSVPDVKKVLLKHGIINTDEVIEEISMLPRKRIKAPPAPAGTISINAAGVKYNIHPSTIQKWVKKGVVPVIKKTLNSTYIDENIIIYLTNLDHHTRHIFIENYNKS